MNAIPGLRQFVSLVSKGGTPIMLADAFGNPYPTTGHGALVFNEGPELSDPTLSGVVIVEDAIHLASGSAANPSLTFGDVPYNFGMYEAGVSVDGVPILTFQPDGISVTGNITYSGQLNGAFHTPMTTRGDLYYMGASGPSRLGIGPAGTTPVSNGVDLVYQPAATGNVTSIGQIDTETVATPNPISTVGTIGLADTAVIPGPYGDATHIPSLLIDQKGRVLGATQFLISVGGTVTSVTPGTGLTSTPNPIVTAGTIALANTPVTPATYGSATQIPQIAIDAQGRITLATNITVSIPPAGVTSISAAGGSGITLTPNPIVATGSMAVDTSVIATVASLSNYLLRSGGTMTGTLNLQPAAPLTADMPALTINQTWNNAAVQFRALTMNVIDTASLATSRLLSLQVGGVDRLALDKFGNLTLAASVNATQGTFSGDVTTNGGSMIIDRTGDAVNGFFFTQVDAGFQAGLVMRTTNLNRWISYKNGTAESGSNVGSDYVLASFNDAGVALNTVIFGKRSTGFIGLNTTGPVARLHAFGVDQTTADFDPAGAQGATVYVQGSGTAVGTGGAVMFGDGFGPFAAIKAYAESGSGPTGALTVSLRRLGTDPAFTEVMRFNSNGGVNILGNAAVTSVGITPPASPLDRQLWWNSDASVGGGQLFIRYNDGSTTQWVAAAPAVSAMPVMSGYLYGCTLANSGALGVVFGSGQFVDSTNAVTIAYAGTTKLLSATWAAGSGAGGRGNGVTLTANTFYHCFVAVINGVQDAFFDTSVLGANAPTGTTYKRRIGSPVLTDGTAANIRAFGQDGDNFWWTTEVADGAALNATALRTMTVPPDLRVLWQGNCNVVTAGGIAGASVYLSTPGVTTTNNAASTSAIGAFAGDSGSSATAASILTNTSRQILTTFASSGAGGSFFLQTRGWVDTRGRLGGP